MGGFVRSDVCISFAGQSLNQQPSASGGIYSYPNVLIASLRAQGIKATRYDTFVGGIAWVQLDEQPGRFAAANAGAVTIQVQCGGTTDYAAGASGLSCFTAMSLIATEGRAAGFDYIIGTTTTPSSTIAGADETQRLDGNSRLMASSALVANGGPFDRVVDLAANASLDDSSDTTYYSDGTHWTIAGAALAASLVEVAVLDVLP